MNKEIQTVWRYGFLAGFLSAIVMFYIWVLTPKADSRPLEDSNIHIVKKQATKRTTSHSKRAS